jgi:hypothetical protein
MLIPLDFSPKICYNYFVIRKLSAPQRGAQFLYLFWAQTLRFYHRFRDRAQGLRLDLLTFMARSEKIR